MKTKCSSSGPLWRSPWGCTSAANSTSKKTFVFLLFSFTHSKCNTTNVTRQSQWLVVDVSPRESSPACRTSWCATRPRGCPSGSWWRRRSTPRAWWTRRRWRRPWGNRQRHAADPLFRGQRSLQREWLYLLCLGSMETTNLPTWQKIRHLHSNM